MVITIFYLITIALCVVFIIDDSKIIKIKGKNKYLTKLIFYGFILIAFFYVLAKFFGTIGFPYDLSNTSSEDRASLGALGDYFGGLLNPIFAFFSFMAVLWTIRENQKSQDFQKFENLFTNLISELSNKINYLYPSNMEEINKKIFGEFDTNVNKRQLIIDNHNFSVFFIFLYQLLRHIDTSLTEEITKKKYANIVRSLIPDEILQLLMINCFHDTEEHNFNKYKELIEMFEFFEHISLYDDNCLMKTSLLLSVATHYESKAFGQNIAYRAFNENLLFNVFKKENNFIQILYDIAKNSAIQIPSISFEENKRYKCFHLVDGNSVPDVACIWWVSKRQFVELRLGSQNVTKIRIEVGHILIFSRWYKHGIKLELEVDNLEKLKISSQCILKYSVSIEENKS